MRQCRDAPAAAQSLADYTRVDSLPWIGGGSRRVVTTIWKGGYLIWGLLTQQLKQLYCLMSEQRAATLALRESDWLALLRKASDVERCESDASRPPGRL